MPTRSEQIRHATLVGVVAVTVFGYVILTVNAASTNYDLWGPLVFCPLLLVASVPLLIRAGRRDPDPRFLKLLVIAFACKAVATVARYLMAFVFYGGVADAAGYSGAGSRLAESYRVGDFSADIGRDFVGTGSIRVLTGLVYTVTGDNITLAYAIFSWWGFWGLYFFYRAFRVAIPEGDARRYAILVLFLPSMLFWPSGLGKEAVMTLGLGVAAYGCALLLSGAAQRSLLPILLGGAVTAMVRPHITAALAVAVPLAVLLARSSRRTTQLTPIIRLASVGVLMAGVYLVAQRAAGFLGLNGLSVKGVNAAIDDTSEQTGRGGSAFTGSGVDSPLDFPRAVATVLFRPTLTDVSNIQLGISALESTVLLVLVVISWRRLRSVPVMLRDRPYLVVCLAYSAIFIYAFSHFSNFGILVRERVQVLPFVLVLLALPPAVPRSRAFLAARRSRGRHTLAPPTTSPDDHDGKVPA